MQYSIPLPVNYDAALIRDRVNARRALFDDHAGLVHKSFIYSEADHIYAPFYVWKDVTEARNFLLDDLFAGVAETFSRQRVRSWVVLDMAYGNKSLRPAYARREVDPVTASERVAHLREKEKAAQDALLAQPGLYMHVTALDADRWEVMRYSLWETRESAAAPATDCFQEYGVLHVSEPA